MPRPIPVLLCLLVLSACTTEARYTHETLPPSPAGGATVSPSAGTPVRAVTPSASPAPSRRRVVVVRRSHAFPITGCRVSYGRSHHHYPATDLFAAKGCRVVSPVAGVVDEVSTVDRWSSSTDRGADRGGLSFSVIGTDGVRYYGSHLATLRVRAGQRVTAGEHVGTVGTTGSARGTAPHLHFGLSWPTRPGTWLVRRGMVAPWRYLDSWRAGGSRSPATEVAAAHQRYGDGPPCTARC